MKMFECANYKDKQHVAGWVCELNVDFLTVCIAKESIQIQERWRKRNINLRKQDSETIIYNIYRGTFKQHLTTSQRTVHDC